jgi:hypothetical protein
MGVLDKSVKQQGGTWTFQCPGVRGHRCGDLGTEIPFVSSGWPTKKVALARGEQHFAEHKGDGPMPELAEFHKQHGLVVNDDGSVSAKLVNVGDL